MIIKVCGMKDAQNIQDLAKLNPDYIGFIFYAKSPRYAATTDKNILSNIDIAIQKVGVFVNESFETILETANSYGLEVVQLHGNESPETCKLLQEEGLTVFKAFPISEASDFEKTAKYDGFCDYFLFDTKTSQHGGSGQKFDWHLLNNYTGETPFLLSGGIDLEDATDILQIKHMQFAGIDINSKFELEPGLKDILKIKKFTQMLNDKR